MRDQRQRAWRLRIAPMPRLAAQLSGRNSPCIAQQTHSISRNPALAYGTPLHLSKICQACDPYRQPTGAIGFGSLGRRRSHPCIGNL